MRLKIKLKLKNQIGYLVMTVRYFLLMNKWIFCFEILKIFMFFYSKIRTYFKKFDKTSKIRTGISKKIFGRGAGPYFRGFTE